MDKDASGAINFDEFCKIMGVEKTGEYKKLFSLFDQDGGGEIDVREFMLGLSNFTAQDKEAKVFFAFQMYDEDNNGFLTEDELIAILKANHMASDEAQVLKKAKTIMRQADRDGDNKISKEEFVVISEKFPNILFPASKVATKV